MFRNLMFVLVAFVVGCLFCVTVKADECVACPSKASCDKLPLAFTTSPLAPLPSCDRGSCVAPLRDSATKRGKLLAKPRKAVKRAVRPVKCGRRGVRTFVRKVSHWRPLQRLRARRCCR